MTFINSPRYILYQGEHVYKNMCAGVESKDFMCAGVESEDFMCAGVESEDFTFLYQQGSDSY